MKWEIGKHDIIYFKIYPFSESLRKWHPMYRTNPFKCETLNSLIPESKLSRGSMRVSTIRLLLQAHQTDNWAVKPKWTHAKKDQSKKEDSPPSLKCFCPNCSSPQQWQLISLGLRRWWMISSARCRPEPQWLAPGFYIFYYGTAPRIAPEVQKIVCGQV